MKFLQHKSLWVLLTVYLALWLIVAVIAGFITDGLKNTINSALNLTGYRTENVSTEGQDTEYFKSKYVQKDDGGNVLYKTEENGYKHQVYDDKALIAADIAKADQVQREGTTILWNTENGLPLAKGDKVSLLSRSSVDYVYSGRGSAAAYTKGAPTMQTALEDAGLTVNPDLWEFYKTGAGKNYVRTQKTGVNEVPWSKYSKPVKDSFAAYGDAAIIVLSRLMGEGSGGQGGPRDGTINLADTPSGDYFDLSAQEKSLIAETVAAKKQNVFKKVVVLLNTPTGLWFAPLLEFKDDIDACLWVGQGGFEGLNEVGRILSGDSIPSGHLVDTFVYNTRSEAAFANAVYTAFVDADKMKLKNYDQQGTYITYAENIYVGYKYYETRYEDAVLGRGNASTTAGAVNSDGNWTYGGEVAFPFGHGGSYTEFTYSDFAAKKNADGDYDVTLTVTNSGGKKGADAVQVYVQKPYTDYDRTYGLEQAAINLAGYAKTAELAPGAHEDVKITVSDHAFKTYDDENKKTYIREKTDGADAYYITAAQDAHAAVNNILAVKGKTPANTAGVMDAAGNADLVAKFEFAADDFTTYAVSESTGAAITNRFEDANWNKYANKTEATVTWLSRNDWSGTYPAAVPVLRMSEAIAADVGWDKDVAVDPKDDMPLYGQPHRFDLIDLKGLAYDHSAWGVLLDQLTLDDQISLLGLSSHGTPAILHIVKPKEVVEDCPMGVRKQYLTNSDGYTMSFPSNVLLAASYNNVLAREVGKLMGYDMLHSGVTGIYAPSANLHRHTYGGRSFEYYSEDGYISGIMAKEQVIGLQSTGAYVNMKHFALNDQESNRFGICTWANEQSIRELYLEAFRPAVEDAALTGVMSAFNRVGTLWSGAHRGLTTDVLRGEWGFEGFVISDCAWRAYMGVVDGLMGGNDCILDERTDLTAYSAAKTNPTVAQAMRESTHRILYVVANGNAMNGISAGTKIYEVREWWQNLILGIQIGLGVLTAAALAIAVLSFLFGKKAATVTPPPVDGAVAARKTSRAFVTTVFDKKTENTARTEQKKTPAAGESETPPAAGVKKRGGMIAWFMKRKILSAVAVCLVIAVVATSIAVPVSLSNRVVDPPAPPIEVPDPPDVPDIPDEPDVPDVPDDRPPSLKDQLEGDLTDYKFEAECGELVTDIEKCKPGLEGTLAACNYPSGDSYIMFLSAEGAATLTYNVTAAEDTRAVLSVCIGVGTGRSWKNLFKLKVNDEEKTPADPGLDWPAFDEAVHEKKWFTWLEQEVAIVDLKKGNNKIEFVKTTNGLNFDYFSLTAAKTLAYTSEVENGGHTHKKWDVKTAPTQTAAGEIVSYCDTCRDKKTAKLPEVSEANGYKKRVIQENGATKFGKAEWTYEYEGNAFTFATRLDPTDARESIRFECEKMDLGGGTKIGQAAAAQNPSGGAYADYISGNKTAKITFDIVADRDTEALMIICFGCRNARNIKFNDGRNLTVNGEKANVGDDVVFYAVDSSYDWYNWQEYELTVLTLKKGRNTIVLTNDGAQFSTMDYYRFISGAELSWYVEE